MHSSLCYLLFFGYHLHKVRSPNFIGRRCLRSVPVALRYMPECQHEFLHDLQETFLLDCRLWYLLQMR